MIIVITVISKFIKGGPIVIKIGNRSIAVDYDIAKNILVKEVLEH